MSFTGSYTEDEPNRMILGKPGRLFNLLLQKKASALSVKENEVLESKSNSLSFH